MFSAYAFVCISHCESASPYTITITMSENQHDTFPRLSRKDILAFQFSSWYKVFSSISIKSTIVRPLDDDFVQYLHSDGVHVPDGSENLAQ